MPVTFTVPAWAAPPDVGVMVKLDVLRVALVIGSEKVAEIDALRATSVALLFGDSAATNGGVVSGAAAVVNCQTKLFDRELPAASFTAVVTVTE